MFENIERDEERGQVGIGTLIVFIALVLVAAIAAGVLINTAGFLQNQAESTGQESTQQVSNNVQVTSVTGQVVSKGNGDSTLKVDGITVTLTSGPGSDPIDLDQTRFELLDQTSDSVKGSAVSGNFTESENSDVVLQPGERVIVTFGLQSQFANDLDPGDQAELTITTPSGSQTTELLDVPDPLANSDDVRL